jgi:hypothetical protein
MGTLLGFFGVLGVYGLVIALTLRARYGLQVAYIEGKRAGLKEAVELAKERGDIAMLVAPRTEFHAGLVRAQTAHQVEMDLRGALARVR